MNQPTTSLQITNSLEKNTDRFNDLPEDFQLAIKGFDYDKRLQELHQTYNLHIDQSAALEKSIADVVFGELEAENLTHNLQKGLHVNIEAATKIALDISKSILTPIRERVKKIQIDEAQKQTKQEDPFLGLKEVM